MVRTLPHRLRDGRCRDCGTYTVSTSPQTCIRCSVQIMQELGHSVLVSAVAAFERDESELWRQVAADIRTGQILADRFYVYVGHNDGGPLQRPVDDLLPGAWQQGTRSAIQAVAEDLIPRYPEVWVVTTVGCWDVWRRPTTEERL